MIEFLENKHGNIALSAIYFWRSVRHLGLGVLDGLRWLHEKVIKRYTLVCMAVVVFLSVLLSTVQKWSRGANIKMPPPFVTGVAIDTAIRELRKQKKLASS